MRDSLGDALAGPAHRFVVTMNHLNRPCGMLNIPSTIVWPFAVSPAPYGVTETRVSNDMKLETECDRVWRIVGGLNDELSRRLLGTYATDLREAQQKQRVASGAGSLSNCLVCGPVRPER